MKAGLPGFPPGQHPLACHGGRAGLNHRGNANSYSAVDATALESARVGRPRSDAC